MKKTISMFLMIAMAVSCLGEYKSIVFGQYAENLVPDTTLTKQGVLSIMFDSSYCENTKQDDIFTVDNRDFILVDSFDNNQSTYYVMSKSEYGVMAFSSGSKKFLPEEEGGLAYYLNHDMLTFLPAGITDYINWEQVWYTEPSDTDSQMYQTIAGVSVPAVWEIEKYKDKVGYDDGFSKNSAADARSYWLRTSQGDDAGANVHQVAVSDKFVFADSVGSKHAIRPQFMLARDFLLKVRPQSMGKNVVSAIVSNYTLEEMLNSKLYSAAELQTMGYEFDQEFPTVGDVSVIKNGNQLNAVYTINGNIENSTIKIEWLSSAAANGVYSVISGETKETLKLGNQYSQKYIKVRITPITGEGYEGVSVTSGNHVFFEGILLTKINRQIYLDKEGYKQYTSSDDTFLFGGQEFILVDTFPDDVSAAFYILANQKYGPDILFGTTTYFNPDEEGSVAYYMNHDLLKMLPEKLVAHICKDYYWLTEPALNQEQYAVRAAVAAPALWELVKYKEIIGYDDVSRWFWTRSPYQDPGFIMSFIRTGTWSVTDNIYKPSRITDTGGTFSLRPQFMLDRSFFLKNKINLADIGKNAQKKIASVYGFDEMLSTGFYSEEELKKMGFQYRYNIDAAYSEYNTTKTIDTNLLNVPSLQSVFTVTNTAQKSVSGTVRFIIYDKNGDLLAVKSKEISVDASTSVRDTIYFEALPEGAYSAKTVFWNEQGIPLCPGVVLTDIETVKQAQYDSLTIYPNKTDRTLTVAGRITDFKKHYLNMVGILISKSGHFEDENLYYANEIDADESGYFTLTLSLDNAEGEYIVCVGLPRGGSTIKKEFYIAQAVIYEDLLKEINRIGALDYEQLGTLLESPENQLSLELPMDIEARMTGTAYKTKIYKALAGKTYSTIEDFLTEYYRQVVVQKISMSNAEETKMIINENLIQLNINGLAIYQTLNYLKDYEEAAYYSFLTMLSGKTYEDYSTFYAQIPETVILAAAYKAKLISMVKIISDQTDYLEKNGFKSSTYNALSETQRANCVAKVISVHYNTLSDFITALNRAIENTPKEQKGGGGNGGGSSSDISKVITAAEASKKNEEQAEEIFIDLGSVEWAKESILALAKEGVISGKGDRKFMPHEFITREEFTKITVAALKYAITGEKFEFNDVNAEEWYAPYVYTARQNGLIYGVDDRNFGVGMPVTRQDMAVVLYRAAGDRLSMQASHYFEDGELISGYARDAVDTLASCGIINGDNNRFSPFGNATRAECAVMVYRFLQQTR